MTDYPDFHFRKYPSADGGDDWYVTLEDCQIPLLGFMVPANYVTDFASVPRLLWSIFSPYGRAANPSILHDWMYTNKPLSAYYGDKVARYIADNLFYENLIGAGVKKWQAKCMYLGVRWFGKSRFGQNNPLYNPKDHL